MTLLPYPWAVSPTGGTIDSANDRQNIDAYLDKSNTTATVSVGSDSALYAAICTETIATPMTHSAACCETHYCYKFPTSFLQALTDPKTGFGSII